MLTIEDISPDKSRLRIFIEENYKDDPFYIDNFSSIQSELGLLEIHNLDESLMLLVESNIKRNTNNGNSYISYLLDITTVAPNGPLKRKGGSLPD